MIKLCFILKKLFLRNFKDLTPGGIMQQLLKILVCAGLALSVISCEMKKEEKKKEEKMPAKKNHNTRRAMLSQQMEEVPTAQQQEEAE